MSILIDEKTRVLVQGMTGREGRFHTRLMKDYGTRVAAGVTPGKGGGTFEGIPLYHRVRDAVEKQGVTASCIFVPPAFAADAVLEAVQAGIGLIVCITEGIPALDLVKVASALKKDGPVLIGPNGPGIISPGKAKIGIMPGPIHRPGSIGVISRSGTLTYEVVDQLTRAGLGQSTCLGIGGDAIVGTSFVDHLKRFEEDPETRGVVMIGEIGGSAEEEAAEFIRDRFHKPVLAFIAGLTAPPGRRMGHAGAIVSGRAGRAEDKIRALEAAGITVERDLGKVGVQARDIMG